jgi:hypothetical protein
MFTGRGATAGNCDTGAIFHCTASGRSEERGKNGRNLGLSEGVVTAAESMWRGPCAGAPQFLGQVETGSSPVRQVTHLGVQATGETKRRDLGGSPPEGANRADPATPGILEKSAEVVERNGDVLHSWTQERKERKEEEDSVAGLEGDQASWCTIAQKYSSVNIYL